MTRKTTKKGQNLSLEACPTFRLIRPSIHFPDLVHKQATPLIVGMGIAAAAMSGRYAIQYMNAIKAAGASGIPKLRKYYDGGFQPTMTKREAALILGTLHASIHFNSHFLPAL